MNRFVKTNNYAGMAQEHYNQARNILLSKPEYLMLPNLVIE